LIYASILAAGLGVRMHRQDMPKQFLLLGEKPIIIHTLEQFFINAAIERIVIVAPSEWAPYTEDLLGQYNLTGKEFAVIPGGINKTVSISMSARYIEQTWGIGDDDVLVAHDGIRPFITQRIIDENIAATQKYGAAVTVMSTNDAILFSKDGHRLHEVPPHQYMFAEQTPQSYVLPTLMKILEKTESSGVSLAAEFDLPRLWIRYEEMMSMIRGEYFNMKIINPYDLEVANALLRERQS